MLVGSQDLEEALARLRSRCADPVAGPWGPESGLWRVARERGVLLGGGRAALLQLAHPYVGEAVAKSDLAASDPAARFRRTFEAVYRMAFGPLDEVLAAARQVHRVHTTVRGKLPAAGRFPAGHAYHANEPSALAWVLATLVDGSLQAYEAFYGPVPPADLEVYWADARAFGLLFGLDDLPPDWPSFRAWVDAFLASDALAVTPAAADVGRRLLAAPDAVTAPIWATYRAVTAALLPPRFREPFGLAYGRRERALAAAALVTLRASYRRLPTRVRCVPEWREARWRLSTGGRRVDRLGRAMDEVVVSLLLRPAPRTA